MQFLRVWAAIAIIALAACGETEQGTIYPARSLVTLSETRGNAVYIVGERIADVGMLEELQARHRGAIVDTRFSENVIVPGLIEHHVHPFLGALAMGVEVIAIEDWHLPTGIKRGVRSATAYRKALETAVANSDPQQELFVSWGYHHYFHEKLTRQDLDAISSEKAIIIIHRSFHEFVMNSKALGLLGITAADIEAAPIAATKFMNIEEGHFAEQGAIAITPKVMPHLAKPERLMAGLMSLRTYLHQQGVTLIANPGAFLADPVQQAKNAVFGADDSPYRSLFIPNGMFIVQKFGLDNLIANTEALLTTGQGKLSYVPKQIKLFADGAMYSQAMQMRDGYLDGHSGAWLMPEEAFKSAFQIYWDAGYQIHVHQNGDAGLDRLLDVLAENMARNPRSDHRTVIVHFGFSQIDQVERIQALGAVVSANPYYVTALSDLYSRKGIGRARAQSMVRLGDVVRQGVRVALHSDMPMAPGAPLFLVHQAVNRINFSNRVAGPEQRLTAEQALRGVTIDAAYMMQLEGEYGSIEAGKWANLTILADNPLTVEADQIKNIQPLATMVEGQIFPINTGAMQ